MSPWSRARPEPPHTTRQQLIRQRRSSIQNHILHLNQSPNFCQSGLSSTRSSHRSQSRRLPSCRWPEARHTGSRSRMAGGAASDVTHPAPPTESMVVAQNTSTRRRGDDTGSGWPGHHVAVTRDCQGRGGPSWQPAGDKRDAASARVLPSARSRDRTTNRGTISSPDIGQSR